MEIIQESNSLLSKLKSGSSEAFTAIYKMYFKKLYNSVLYLVKDEMVADELIQDLFFKVWQKRTEIDPLKSFQAYLYAVAQNLVYDHFRKLASDKRLMDKMLDVDSYYYLHSDKLLEDKESRKILNGAINSLTPQRRLAFTYCKLEGYSYQQASEELGISVATINSHISHSYKLIRAYILKSYN